MGTSCGSEWGRSPGRTSPAWLVDFAVLAEEAGLDLVALQDHPYQPRHLDTLTALGQIGARVPSGSGCCPMWPTCPCGRRRCWPRPWPASIVVTRGRVELGLGAGVLLGRRRRLRRVSRGLPEEAVDAVSEAIDVIRLLWTPGEPVSYDGDHYRLDAAPTEAVSCASDGDLGGAYKPRTARGHRGQGRRVDSVQGLCLPGGAPKLSRIIDEAAGGPRRSPQAFNISGSFDPRGTGWFEGPPELWAEQLAELRARPRDECLRSRYVRRTPAQDLRRRGGAEGARARSRPNVRSAASTITTLIDDAPRPRLPKQDTAAALAPAAGDRQPARADPQPPPAGAGPHQGGRGAGRGGAGRGGDGAVDDQRSDHAAELLDPGQLLRLLLPRPDRPPFDRGRPHVPRSGGGAGARWRR